MTNSRQTVYELRVTDDNIWPIRTSTDRTSMPTDEPEEPQNLSASIASIE